MLTQMGTRLSSIPRKIWIIVAGVALVVTLGIVVLAILQPFGGAFTSLNTANPSIMHPDGLVVRLAEGTSELQVRVSTIPREVFIADQAGKQWGVAHQTLQSRLTPLSPIYTVDMRGGHKAIAEMAIPNGSEPLALLTLYRWEPDEERWISVPSTLDLARQVIVFTLQDPSQSIMAFHVQPEPLTAGVVVSEGGGDLGVGYDLVFPEGVSIDSQGEFVGEPLAVTATTVMPLIDNRAGGFMAYPDPAQQTRVIDRLMSIAESRHGLLLDFNIGQGYGDFLAILAEQLHAQDKRLDIIVRGTTFDAAELAGLSAHVDRVWLAPGDDPMLYLPNGQAEEAIKRCVSQVDRSKVGLMTSGLNVEITGETIATISREQALALFGSIEPVAGYLEPDAPLAPGDALPLRLNSRIESMGFDAALGMNYLTYHDANEQLHTVYFGSARGLNNKLSWANTYGLGAVSVYGLAHPQAPAHLPDGLNAFLGGQAAGEPAPLSIVWRVADASGSNLTEQEGDLSLIQYLWQASGDPGEYAISAGVKGEIAEAEVGKLMISIGERATEIPTLTVTPTESLAKATPDPNATPVAQPTATVMSDTMAIGAFELGGQTHHLGNPDKMHFAGMTWVKFQHKWGPGDNPADESGRIGQAHGQGFKVLMSVPGPSYPSSIDYGSYVGYLAGLASQGVDGIEVWNEMNIDREWPASDISGASYVNNMLKPAYEAIKAANPNVLVISGAPAPTGFFGGCGANGCDDWMYLIQMRDAGAGNYMDCMGIHYNEGIIPPSQNSGDPRSEHYTRYYAGMVDTYYGTLGKTLCFTELGYLSPDGYGALPSLFAWAKNVTVAQQAQWLAEAAILSSQSGKVRLMIVFNVDFTVWEPNDPQAGYAMVRPGGSCPACDALHSILP
ncbi:MAG: hypothetical protein JXB07_20585 [Anaerolineae bacterium]|nr:hypothetical protein [Anaerolineae bacterium]